MAPLRERSDDTVLPDPPPGPLHVARARASFPWKELALFWEGEDTLRFKVRLGWWPLGALVARGEGALLSFWFICRKMEPGMNGHRLGFLSLVPSALP